MFPSSSKKDRHIDTGFDPGPITVLHVSTPKSWRGGEQQLLHLYDELNAQGVQQSILCPEGSALEQKAQEGGREYVPFSWKGPLALGLAWQLKNLVRSYQPELIHTHDSHAHTAAFLAALLFRTKVPIIVHRRVDFPVGKSAFSRWKYDHPIVKKVIAVSDAIHRIGKEGVRVPEKWTSIHSGIGPEAFERKGEKGGLRKELKIDDRTPIIGNVAALADHKDHPAFVQCARRFFEKGGKAHFVIIGEGPDREKVEEEIRKEGMEKKVSLLGFRPDVRECMQDFDIFLMSSKTEGLGTSVLDAMALGIPVVSTNAGGLPEIVKDGKNGMLCEIKDIECLSEALIQLLGDEDKRERLGRSGIETAKQRSRGKMASSVLATYRSVLERTS